MPDPTTGWPTADDLRKMLLVSTGLAGSVDATATVLFESEIAAAIGRWQRDSGYYPFLAAPSVRTFSPSGNDASPTGLFFPLLYQGGSRRLILGSGLLSVNSISVGTIGGGALQPITANSDYYLQPSDAPFRGEPYTWVEFRTPSYGLPNSIVIDGVWGYQAKVEPMFAQAILADAAVQCSPQLAISTTGLLSSRTERDVKFQWSENPFAGYITTWANQRMRALAYLRSSQSFGVM